MNWKDMWEQENKIIWKIEDYTHEVQQNMSADVCDNLVKVYLERLEKSYNSKVDAQIFSICYWFGVNNYFFFCLIITD